MLSSVPHNLRDYEVLGCVDAYKDFMGTPDGESTLLNTVKESWCFQYDPEMKRENGE